MVQQLMRPTPAVHVLACRWIENCPRQTVDAHLCPSGNDANALGLLVFNNCSCTPVLSLPLICAELSSSGPGNTSALRCTAVTCLNVHT